MNHPRNPSLLQAGCTETWIVWSKEGDFFKMCALKKFPLLTPQACCETFQVAETWKVSVPLELEWRKEGAGLRRARRGGEVQRNKKKPGKKLCILGTIL